MTVFSSRKSWLLFSKQWPSLKGPIAYKPLIGRGMERSAYILGGWKNEVHLINLTNDFMALKLAKLQPFTLHYLHTNFVFFACLILDGCHNWSVPILVRWLGRMLERCVHARGQDCPQVCPSGLQAKLLIASQQHYHPG